MPQLKLYHSNDDLPIEHEYQIRAFVRILWHDAYLYDIDAPIVPPEKHPHHVVVAEKHALISYARVNWVNVTFAGETYRTYCIGDVFTYPAFRQKGYGRQVVDAATTLIRADAEADIAILFTDPHLDQFYGQSGWQHMSGLKVSIGDEAQPHSYDDAYAMMLFLSPKARQHREDFDQHRLYLPGYGW